MRPDAGRGSRAGPGRVVELDQAGRLLLRAAIGETPATLMSREQLRRGLCRATVLGTAGQPLAAAVQPFAFPGDVSLYGDDAEALFALLTQLDDWEAADVALERARPLAAWLGWATRQPVAFAREHFFALETPAPALSDPAVRLLGEGDRPLLEAATAPLEMGDWRFGSAAALLAEGLAAGAVIDGALVAVAFTAALGERYVDVGIVTRPDFRGQGLATSAAALVCQAIQADGRTPAWGTSEENLASQRVAAKLGFREVAQRVYLVPDAGA
ncbi:MAG: GNAT family N-acetyltransferase [Thermomicrobiales bacterium]|nr:GNAT family N-acetyltransferase [Thermomicrobiales bacterium]